MNFSYKRNLKIAVFRESQNFFQPKKTENTKLIVLLAILLGFSLMGHNGIWNQYVK